MLKTGNIVRLHTPFKPREPETHILLAVAHHVYPHHEYYHNQWRGFTHGIVAASVDYEEEPTEVTLYLYTPDNPAPILYTDSRGLPVGVDYSVDEFEEIPT